jgi:hypothetical protein
MGRCAQEKGNGDNLKFYWCLWLDEAQTLCTDTQHLMIRSSYIYGVRYSRSNDVGLAQRGNFREASGKDKTQSFPDVLVIFPRRHCAARVRRPLYKPVE